jgi:putative endonuclease
VCSNFHCRYGELDLVMRERDCLVIVEVRYRRSDSYGGALPSITAAKLQRIAKTIQHLLWKHRQLRELPLRFDVIALAGLMDEPTVTWCQRAYSFDDVS